MARTPKPWYWDERQAYYVTIRGKRHRLGEDKKDADRRYHQLMAAAVAEVAPPAPSGGVSVAEVFEKYLDWCQKHRAEETYLWARKKIQSFCDFLGKRVRMPAAEVKPLHLTEWVDSHATWGANHKRGGMVAVQRAFGWAAKQGYLTHNPVAGVEKPKATRRESFVTVEDFHRICGIFRPDDPFRALIEFLWETGCRPQEARHIEARHVDLAGAIIAIPPAEAKGRKRWRLIRLTDRAVELVRAGLARGGSKVFVNKNRAPWRVGTMATRFRRVKKKLGVRFAAYDFRHGFAQRMLESGNDHLTVAELMGHASGQMLATVYSHMNKADRHLRDPLRKGSGKTEVAGG